MRSIGAHSRDIGSYRRVACDHRHALRLRLMGSGLRKPKSPISGTDLAGHVESIEVKTLTRFKPGDEYSAKAMVGFSG